MPNICEDYYPTLCNWAGISNQLADREDIDGRDLTADVTGKAPKVTPALLFHYPHVWGPRGPGYEPHSSIRFGDWKAIYFYQPQRWELYNLKADLGEAKNLASTSPKRLKELSDRMKIEHDRRGAQYPANRETQRARTARLAMTGKTSLFLAVPVVHHRVLRADHSLVVGDAVKDDRHEGFRFLFQGPGDATHQQQAVHGIVIGVGEMPGGRPEDSSFA